MIYKKYFCSILAVLQIFYSILRTHGYRNYFELCDPGLIDFIEKHKFNKNSGKKKIKQLRIKNPAKFLSPNILEIWHWN